MPVSNGIYMFYLECQIEFLNIYICPMMILMWVKSLHFREWTIFLARMTLKYIHLTLFGNHLLVRAKIYAPCCEFGKVCCFVYKHTKWKIELQIWYVKISRDTKCQNERQCVTSYDDNFDIVPTSQTCLKHIFIILHSITH